MKFDSHTVCVTRGKTTWFVQAPSVECLKDVCKKRGWEFNNFEKVSSGFGTLRKRWVIGKLIDEIGGKCTQKESGVNDV